jgi:hypothetical protein
LPEERTVRLDLRPEAAEILHAAIEGLLENGSAQPALEEAYRVLTWRILAAKGEAGEGSGLTARMAELARDARTVEEYEAARDAALGPLLSGLESPENRDP